MRIDHYFKYFIIFNILLAITPAYLQINSTDKSVLIPYFWQLFAGFALLNLLIYLLSYWHLFKSPTGSVVGFLGSIGIKFILWMILVFIYISNIKVDSGKFLLEFFYLYLFNSVFEIYCLLRNLRNQNLR